jgi:hypothetical protein
MLHLQFVVPRGRVGETATALHRLPAFAFRRPLFISGLGAGLTDLEARAPEPFTACGGVPSHLWLGTGPRLLRLRLLPTHSRETEILLLGIANLLPQLVPVKRETLQVVSLTMTGLVRG